MTRFVSIVMVIVAAFFIWLLILTISGCQTRSSLFDMQSRGVTVNTDTTEVQQKVEALEAEIDSLSTQLEQYLQDQANQAGDVPTETDINIQLRGDWTPAEQRQLERILRDAINNP